MSLKRISRRRISKSQYPALMKNSIIGMKRVGLIVALLCALVMPAVAQERIPDCRDCFPETEGTCHDEDQPRKDHKERGGKKSKEEMLREIQEFKLKYLAQEMGLSEAQKKEFNEIYTQMSMEKGKIFHECHQIEKEMRDNPNLSDEDYAKASEKLEAAREKEALIDRVYDGKFATFLSAKQIYKMKQAEKAFLEKLREMRHRKTSGKK